MRRGLAGIEELYGAMLWVGGDGSIWIQQTNCARTSYGAGEGVVTDTDLSSRRANTGSNGE